MAPMAETIKMNETITLLQQDFNRLSQFIHQNYGIKMPPAKKVLLESRLQKRLRALDITTFKDYCDYLLSSQGRDNELVYFVDKITTNKTDFFREPEHFDYLTRHLLPKLVASYEVGCQNLSLWSAGCSTGEEPYTLAMILNEYQDRYPKVPFNYSILGSDISMEVLRNAKSGGYFFQGHSESIQGFDLPLKLIHPTIYQKIHD